MLRVEVCPAVEGHPLKWFASGEYDTPQMGTESYLSINSKWFTGLILTVFPGFVTGQQVTWLACERSLVRSSKEVFPFAQQSVHGDGCVKPTAK